MSFSCHYSEKDNNGYKECTFVFAVSFIFTISLDHGKSLMCIFSQRARFSISDLKCIVSVEKQRMIDWWK